jgi:iron(II)-dependent oxidoreductase
LWELGHIAWFQEFWLHRGGDFDAPSILPHADRWYDSARVAHDTRWSLDLPDWQATRAYFEAVLERSLSLLDCDALTDARAYFAQLALFHQDMHNEAFCYMWQTLGYPMPVAWPEPGASIAADIGIPASSIALGARPGSGFVFDNEKWAHEVRLPAFGIARRAVTNAEYREFVDAGGYVRREFWSELGWAMRERLALDHPRYWRRDADAWSVRRFDRWLPLAAHEPVMHVSCHEAEAYCVWAGRRLPSEAEWVCRRCLLRSLGLRAGMGMDLEPFWAVSGIHRRSLPGILGALVRRRASRAARRQLCHAAAVAAQDMAQFLQARAGRHVLRFSDLRNLKGARIRPSS